MDMLCVHPAYWKRGHGTQLAKRTIELCKTDKVAQGVNAAGMGAKLYKTLGYEYICTQRRVMTMILKVYLRSYTGSFRSFHRSHGRPALYGVSPFYKYRT